MSTVEIRQATADDELAVRRILDAAVLAYESLAERIDAGEVLVASARDSGAIVGGVVLDSRADRDGAVVTAIAVRQARRGQGIATALLTAALDREARLRARFSGDVRPFYESLGFEIEPVGDDRYEGVCSLATLDDGR